MMMDGTAVEYSPELPEPLIQRIQSLLLVFPEKAVKTTLISKSWFQAWSTRPTIDLDDSYYPTIDKFQKFANKTLQMYEESNLRIHTFRLRLDSPKSYVHSALATEWTLKALELGATNLVFRSNHLDLAILLNEVSERENIASLCLQSSKIVRPEVLKFPGLKSLTLSELTITLESFFNVISCCPLIENLSLSDFLGRHQHHKSDFCGSYDDHAPPTFSLQKLRTLVLCRIPPRFRIKTLFLDDLSSKFPNLKHLTLELSSSNVDYFRKQGEKHVITSRSLEVLNITVGTVREYDYEENKKPRFDFDVPSLREFTLDCVSTYMLNVCFTSTSMDRCESHVSLAEPDPHCIQWLLNLSKLLTELRGSKINLCLHLDDRIISFFYSQKEIIKCTYEEITLLCLNVCELENLTIAAEDFPSRSYNALLDGLFRICRPKMISQYNHPYYYYDDDDDDDDDDDISVDDAQDTINNDVELCQELVQGMRLKSLLLIPSQHMYGLRDLEELHVEKLLDGFWRPQPLDSILDDSSKQQRFRFQLKWKPS